jgi:phosphoglycolate phosphatase-like HAD superfamily hydrolase
MPAGEGSRRGARVSRYKAVVFDLDGTLIDAPIDFRAMHRAVIQASIACGIAPGRAPSDGPLPEMMARAHGLLADRGYTDGMREEFDQEVGRRFDQIEMDALPRSKPMPGASEALSTLQNGGFRLGILTRSCGTYAREALKRTEMERFFAVTRTRDYPGPQKPDPRSLIWVLEQLGTRPQEAVYVGDRGLDRACALAARVDFLGMVWPGEGEAERMRGLQDNGRSIIVHSFRELLDRISTR